MRVVSGKFKGLNLSSPKALNSRPTDNKVKEAIFGVLFPFKDNFLALDLFACTGQIGIEFLSRGAEFVTFGELNYKNYIELNKNLDKLNIDNYKCIKGDFRKVLEIISKESIKYDYIFLDPPYKEDYLKICLNLIQKYDLLKKDGIIITESDRDLDFSDETIFKLVKEKSYGRKIVKFYEYEGDISR